MGKMNFSASMYNTVSFKYSLVFLNEFTKLFLWPGHVEINITHALKGKQHERRQNIVR